MKKTEAFVISVCVLFLLILLACGGGGGDDVSDRPAETPAVGGRSNPSAGTSVSMYMKLRTPTFTPAFSGTEAEGTPEPGAPSTSVSDSAATALASPVAVTAPSAHYAVTTTAAGASPAPVVAPPSEQGVDALKVGLVSDTTGFSDNSVNENARAAVQAALNKLGGEGQFVESKQADNYTANIQELIGAGCNVIIAGGPSLAESIADNARQHRDLSFAILNHIYKAAKEGDPDPYAADLKNVSTLLVTDSNADSAILSYLQSVKEGTVKSGVVSP